MCFLYVIATKTSIAEGLSNKIIGKEKFGLDSTALQWKKGFSMKYNLKKQTWIVCKVITLNRV